MRQAAHPSPTDERGGIRLDAVSKSYGGVQALAGLTLAIRPGEFVTLLGPSGSGKTTTMRMIAGLERPTSGTISIGGRVASGNGVFLPTHRRGLGMVFQSYAVWPHKTVEQNVAFPLQQRGMARPQREAQARAMLDRVGLAGYADRHPSQLSGGQQQRVSLARALVASPEIILFDEPLSNLDAQLRETMRDLLADLHRAFGTTSVYVTHDQTEAMALSDRVFLMNRGQLVQSGPPEELYEQPANRFVAEFIGASNILAIETLDPATQTAYLRGGARLVVTQKASAASGTLLMIRPHRIIFATDDEVCNVVQGSVQSASYLGDRTRYVVEIHGGLKLSVEAVGGAPRFQAGQNIRLRLPPESCLVL